MFDAAAWRQFHGDSRFLLESRAFSATEAYVATMHDSADGIVIESHGLIIDEASLTGEADPIKKTLEDPWVRSGTQVSTSPLCLSG